MFKYTIPTLACLGALLSFQTAASGAIVTLKNGDRLTGTVLSQEGGVIKLKTDHLGVLSIPSTEASVEMSDSDKGIASTEAAKADVEAKAAAAATATPAETAEQEKIAQEDKPEEEQLVALEKFAVEARGWVNQWVPEGWSGRFHLGYQFTETNSSTTSWTIGMNAEKNVGDHHYSINAFYDYKSTTNQQNVQDKQIDKWGGGFRYRWDFDENFFFLANTSYLRDQVKDIRNEVTQDIGIGYYFYNTPDMVLYVAPAFTPQYKDAEGIGKKWYYMASVLQEFKYKLNSSVRFEQSAQGSVEPGDTHNYSYKFRIAAITKLTDWVDLIVSYNYNFDNTVGTGGSKKEQIAAVSLGIPF